MGHNQIIILQRMFRPFLFFFCFLEIIFLAEGKIRRFIIDTNSGNKYLLKTGIEGRKTYDFYRSDWSDSADNIEDGIDYSEDKKETGKTKDNSKDEQTPGKNENCTTKACIDAAADILARLDKSVDPCEDFYDFACGNYIKKAEIPGHKEGVSTKSEVSDKLKKQVAELLEGDIKATEPKPVRLTKSMYQSCMNQKKIEEKGLTPLKNILKKLGGWPLLEGDSWNQEGFTWYNMVYNFSKEGLDVDHLVHFFVELDPRNSSLRTLFLSEPKLGLPGHLLGKGMEDKNVQAYFSFMKDTAALLGSKKKAAEKQMKKVLDFEIQLAKITLPREQRRDIKALVNPMTIKQIEQLDPSTPWLEYINTILPPKVQVELSETINVLVPSYIKSLWISGAQMYCSKIRDKTLEMQILAGMTPYRFRVQGTFSNMDDFARDFKCKAGTRMNPTKKCKVW